MKSKRKQLFQTNFFRVNYKDEKNLSLGSIENWTEDEFLNDWSIVEHLKLQSCNLNNNSLKLIINLNFANLKTFNLNYNEIGNNGVKFLIKMNLYNLETLLLYDCPIGDEGIKHMTKGYWPKLKTLALKRFYSKSILSRFQLNSSEIIIHNFWKNLNTIIVQKIQPICLINGIFSQADCRADWRAEELGQIQCYSQKLCEQVQKIVWSSGYKGRKKI